MLDLRNYLYQTLRKGESLFKTDMIYLAKGGGWLVFGQAIATFLGFFVSIAFANLISKESFGIYKFVLSMAGIVGAFSLTGLGVAVTQSVAKGFEVLSRGFRHNLKWSLGIFLGGIALFGYYLVNGNLLLSTSFLLMSISLPITTSATLYGAYLLGKKDFRRNSLFGIISNLIPAATILIAIVFTKNIWVIIFAYFSITALTTYYLYRKTLAIYASYGRRDDPELLSYGKHLSAMDVIGRIAGYVDKILIFHYLGAAPLAIYSFAIAPVEQLQSGKKILSTLILPKISRSSFKELQNTTPKKSLSLALYGLALAGLWMLAAPYFYKLLYPQYLDSVFYSQIYSLTLLAVAGTLFNETLVAHQKKKELYIHRTVMPIAQLILFFIMLPLYGLTGLIITHVIIRSTGSILGYFLVKTASA
ncbi:MAG: hypothetical protein A2758_01610 [Candidatus Zambryskibacteria bacterium RIFCSPHIGHO2_01_FULL_49_18]|uniref:Polysaccharide biosynthesis protein C-terminal domain-containing protein n=2 Tax=Candidatus Zambryskiibacteriota TaxID=1817925 RepID=A0A1G2T1I9_9BACT|nr:MAG: hypothetical protein A2758_01610 [Candidatus Zambryskibacteria bacterium RIFCSPHIGHO2_01_FULL_49_18]OHB05194.1 MAG: hypothetical protein A3A26_02745 [Candidatus Zambryskibacteria bacterium RIFCSPLOWO2_01_FULL_47_14]